MTWMGLWLYPGAGLSWSESVAQTYLVSHLSLDSVSGTKTMHETFHSLQQAAIKGLICYLTVCDLK